jgi:SLT domain-containing protein
MTRAQQRLNARHRRALATGIGVQEAQDAVIGDALYRRNQAKLTPIDRACRDRSLHATALQAYNQGIDFIDFYVAVFRRMPRVL